MERTRTPLSIWFWAAYLVSTHTAGMSAVQFQRQLGLNRYETAFQILHKLRAGMVRPDRDRIGAHPRDHVEIDESWVGGRTRGAGRGVHDQSLVVAAVEVRQRKPENHRRGPRSWPQIGAAAKAVPRPILLPLRLTLEKLRLTPAAEGVTHIERRRASSLGPDAE